MKTIADVRIIPGKSTVVACGPPGENRWGFYQFPDMWRAPGREIFLAMNVGHDCEIGQHEPSWLFVSRDDGKTWTRIPYEQVDQSPPAVTFSDGSQVAFGETHYIYHVHSYGPYQQPWQWWRCKELGVEPCSGLIWDAYDNYQWLVYRYPDLPEKARQMPMAWRKSKNDPWQKGHCILDAPEMLLGGLGRPWWWDEKGNRMYEDIPPRIFRAWPRDVVVMPDDTLLWVYCSVHPASLGRKYMYWKVDLFASTDRGRTWKHRGVIADDTDLTTDGYSGSEHSLQVMPNGDLYCVMRTELGDHQDSTQWLAASRSTDGGFTWSKPVEIAPFSVTPIMFTLANGMVALTYGRPGVYVRASGDSGKTWTDALPVVGPSEAELMKDKWWKVRYDHISTNKISCGNLGAVVTGSDRFLLAYSDFHHRNEKGEDCKAVLVREFAIQP